MVLERILTFVLLALANWLLALAVRPSRREKEAILVTAALATLADLAFEVAMGKAGIWEYEMPGSFRGVPIDLPGDMFLVCAAFCQGLAYFRRRPGAAPERVYIASCSLALGTHAWLKNSRVAETGSIRFKRSVSSGPAFVLGNYLSIALLLLMVSRAYRVACRHDSHG